MDIPTITLEFTAEETERHISELSALLHACVHDGASIGFILPHSQLESEAFWRKKVLPAVAEGTRILLVAKRSGRIIGSVQLDYDTPSNQPHRAEVRKLLVHPEFRRLGIARALMAELERRAVDLKRSLLTLDTRTGDKAEPLYASLGYQTTGTIPCYCRDTIVDRLDATTIMYKMLS
jgi:ribosomal protein S18 acetylase RimI-like enzyme